MDLGNLEAYIYKLPSELLEICLTPCFDVDEEGWEVSWLNVVIVSKRFETESSRLCGKVFRNISVLHQRESLRILKKVSGRAALAKHVRKVTVTQKDIRDMDSLTESDKSILTQAFKRLPEIASIQIDRFSFFESSQSFRCGGSILDEMYDGYLEEDPDCAVYDFALQALVNAEKHTSVAICLDFPSPNGNIPPGLSLSSAHWVACSSQVCSLTFSGNTSTKWHKELLGSTKHLTQLAFNSCGTLQVKELTQHISLGLKSFELDDVFCSCSELEEFFNRHQDSIVKVRMTGVSSSETRWAELIRFIRTMPKLESLEFWDPIVDDSESI